MLSPEWRYLHFLDSDIIHFFKANPLKEFSDIVEKFNSIKQGEHKADLFRYYFLYVKGGVFMDSDAMIYQPIDSIIKDYKFFSVRSVTVPGTIFQGILGAEPENMIIYNALRSVYTMDVSQLQSDYHILCKQLFTFFNSIADPIHYKLYEEIPAHIDQSIINNYKLFQGDSIINDDGLTIFKHYWAYKEGIPNTIRSKNLVYCCVFYNKDYLKLLDLLLKSMKFYSPLDFDFLVITQSEFSQDVLNMGLKFGIDIKIFTLECKTIFEAACARLRIFDYPDLHYDKLLYIDTDILIKADLNPIFNLDIKDLLHGIQSGTIESENFGSKFFNFNKISRSLTGINSGTLLFLNSETMKSLFQRILDHVNTFILQGRKTPYCLDQPFINYHAIKDSLYDNQLLNPHVSLYEGNDTVENYETSSICHFSYPIGNFSHKYNRMCEFLEKTLNKHITYTTTLDIIGKTFSWGKGYIKFIIDKDGMMILETHWGRGMFNIKDSNIIIASWNGSHHILRFNSNSTEYISIRIGPRDFEYSTGFLIDSHLIIYGDSHGAASFTGLTVPHRNLFLHGVTMYRIGRDQTIVNFDKSHLSKNTTFCLAYGEIDVRCHIGVQEKQGRNYLEICQDLVDSYFKTIEKNLTEYKAIVIVGVSPPTDQADHTHDHPLPFIGSNSDRVKYTDELNRLLKEYCVKYNYKYFNPYLTYRRSDGCLNYDLSDKCVHIGNTSYFLNSFNTLYKTIDYPVTPVVLHTFDKYKKFWNPWFHYFKKNVKGPYKIYFLSEEEAPDFYEEVIHIKTGSGEWGQRLLTGLKQIPEDYIYYMQEDFWAFKPIDLSIYLDTFIDYNMDVLRISSDSPLYTLENINNIYKFSQNSAYLMTHQFSLWNKSYFMKYVNPEDCPWSNEIKQTQKIAKTPHSIYMIKNEWYNPVVTKGILQPIGELMLTAISS
jgi:hypothetical protein